MTFISFRIFYTDIYFSYKSKRNAITLIRDFIQIANGLKPQWLPNSPNHQINYKNIGTNKKNIIN